MPAKRTPLFFVLLLFLASFTHAQDLTTRVADLLAEMPAGNLEIRDDLMQRLVDTGPEGIALISQMLLPPGEGDDTRARYALSSLGFYASQSGREEQREFVETGLLAALGKTQDLYVKAFLVDQLLLVVSENAIDDLAPLLVNERLSGHVARVLLTVPDERAAHAFLEALHSTKGTLKVQMMNNLGYLQADESVNHILPYLNDDDVLLRRASLGALARIGHPSYFSSLRNLASQNTPENQRFHANENFVIYANRLCERGEYRLCRRATRFVIDNNASTGRYHNYASALATYTRFFPDEALPLLMNAIKTNDHSLRGAVLNYAQDLGGERETRRWVSLAENSASDVKADIIHMLGLRGDPVVSGFLRRSMGDPSAEVRVESMKALAILERETFAEELLRHLAAGRDIEASGEILMRILRKDQLPLVVSEWDNTSGKSRAMLIDLIAARAGEDYFERIFAATSSEDSYEKAAAFSALDRVTPENELDRLIELLTVVEEPAELRHLQYAISKIGLRSENRDEIAGKLLGEFHTSDEKEIYLALLPAFGGEKALSSVVALYRDSEGSLRESAAFALINWSDFSASDILLEMVRTGSEDVKGRALQSYVNLLQQTDVSDEQKLEYLKNVWEHLETVRQKSFVIRNMGQLRTWGSLEFLEAYLDDSDLQQEASMSILAIALPVVFDDAEFTGAYVNELLRKVASVIAGAESEYIRANIMNYLRSAELEEGFVSLFNGRNLDGWQGNTTGYVVENGILVFRPELGERGHLYTDREYSDFIIRFEFQLTPGANNGLAIRTPLEGDPAYAGMEIQILDDDDPIYENLREYQYHGSVYGIIPAKRGFLNPVGEWNYQEVIAKGTHITVILNGETIVDGCVHEASKNGTIDGRDHPGVLRESGYIAFMSHGTVVSFRNIRIKDLASNKGP